MTSHSIYDMKFFVMSFSLHEAQIVQDQLLAACSHCESLLHRLVAPDASVCDLIHQLRKLGKSLRGGIAMCKLDPHALDHLQAIGRMFSDARDSFVRLQTWDALNWHEDAIAYAAITAALEAQLDASSSPPSPAMIDWCLMLLGPVTDTIRSAPIELMAQALAIGIQQQDELIAKRCLQLQSKHPERFHRCRKAIKARLGGLDYLPCPQPELKATYKPLSDQLGEENDLATLAHWLDHHGFSQKLLPSLWCALKDKQRALQQEIEVTLQQLHPDPSCRTGINLAPPEP